MIIFGSLLTTSEKSNLFRGCLCQNEACGPKQNNRLRTASPNLRSTVARHYSVLNVVKNHRILVIYCLSARSYCVPQMLLISCYRSAKSDQASDEGNEFVITMTKLEQEMIQESILPNFFSSETKNFSIFLLLSLAVL